MQSFEEVVHALKRVGFFKFPLQQNIRRLDIPVNDVSLFMQVRERLSDLACDDLHE